MINDNFTLPFFLKAALFLLLTLTEGILWKKRYEGRFRIWMLLWICMELAAFFDLDSDRQTVLFGVLSFWMWFWFFEDACFYYFSKYQALAAILFMLAGTFWSCMPWQQRALGLAWAVCVLPFCLQSKMGWADFWFLVVFGWVLGWRRMVPAFCISLVIGIAWGLVQKGKGKGQDALIPYVSCLCLAGWFGLLKGFWLWGLLAKQGFLF